MKTKTTVHFGRWSVLAKLSHNLVDESSLFALDGLVAGADAGDQVHDGKLQIIVAGVGNLVSQLGHIAGVHGNQLVHAVRRQTQNVLQELLLLAGQNAVSGDTSQNDGHQNQETIVISVNLLANGHQNINRSLGQTHQGIVVLVDVLTHQLIELSHIRHNYNSRGDYDVGSGGFYCL